MNNQDLVKYLVNFIKSYEAQAELMVEANWCHSNEINSYNPNYLFKNFQLMANYGTEHSGWIARVIVNRHTNTPVHVSIYDLNYGIEEYQKLLDEKLPSLEQLRK